MNIDTKKLRGKHVYLEVLQPEHRELIRPLAKDERIWEYNGGLVTQTNYDHNFDSYFDIALDKKANGEQQTFTINRVDTGEIIGMTRLFGYNERDKSLELGYTWYIPSAWGKVYNKECKFLLLQYAFEEMHLHRVQFKVAHQNIRSQKAVEKIGGVKEGVLRKHGYRMDGILRDAVIFSIIDDEWQEKKEKLIDLIVKNE
jgi:RimJ/RimL family protein N-acetyltransferase